MPEAPSGVAALTEAVPVPGVEALTEAVVRRRGGMPGGRKGVLDLRDLWPKWRRTICKCEQEEED